MLRRRISRGPVRKTAAPIELVISQLAAIQRMSVLTWASWRGVAQLSNPCRLQAAIAVHEPDASACDARASTNVRLIKMLPRMPPIRAADMASRGGSANESALVAMPLNDRYPLGSRTCTQ